MEYQKTIKTPVSLEGRGLFGGQPVKLTFKPAPPDHGLVFIRMDLGGARVTASINNVIKRPRRSALRQGDAVVETCEHCLSAAAGLHIDNLIIELDAAELPALDGSAKPYVDALVSGEIVSSKTPRKRLIVTKPIIVRQEHSMVAAIPLEETADKMEIVYDLDYAHKMVGRQVKIFDTSNGEYVEEIAPARTYVLEEEARALQEEGIGTHLGPEDVLVIGKDGPLAGNDWRYDDEPVRHKIVDLIGDLYLLGAPIRGRIIAHRSGHALNHLLVKKLIEQHQAQQRHELAQHGNLLDIRKLVRILPHRYPMLLVDRVVEIDADQRAVGIKNVTINEPFFQGHYPGSPIMPGVLVVEAMAQLSGVLIGQKLEHTGKLAVLLSLDRVKLRRPVIPGDQLVMEAQTVRMRSRIAHMRCRAYVAEEIAAEAEVKFMLVDDEKE